VPGLLGDLLKLLGSGGPFPFELAEQLATTVADDGASSGNPDPSERIRLEELLGIAELHVGTVTGMAISPTGRPLQIVTLGRGGWARRFLAEHHQLLERLAKALRPAGPPPTGPDATANDPSALIAQWTGLVAPAIVAMQFGSIVGHLARRALGSYSLPLPGDRPSTELAIVPENLHAFATDWSVSIDDLRLAVLIQDLATHVVLAQPHVRERLDDLLLRHAQGLQPPPGAFEARLGEAAAGSDLGDLGALMAVLGDPASLGELIDTPEVREVRRELSALAATIAGYVDWVFDEVGRRAIGSTGAIREALRRSRVEPGEDAQGDDVLFGDLVAQRAIDRGTAFVRGVLERGGESELAKLWVVESYLPTPAELDAPGLWLERIHLPPLDVPDTLDGLDGSGEGPDRS
jgi:putative hydrolase